jgi:hypothetical protein
MQQYSNEIACIVGKPHLLDKMRWENPIIFGPAIYSHPCDDPHLLKRLPVRRILASCEWLKQMYESYFGEGHVSVWPAGIDTDQWIPKQNNSAKLDFILYDKIRWNRDSYEKELLAPIKVLLKEEKLNVQVVRYGFYREEEFQRMLQNSKAMLFLCEHETQGFAYLQALSSGVPILAWDRGGFWQDPSYFPEKVQFSPVTSVPYWDERCGVKFRDAQEFPAKLQEFIDKLNCKKFAPRNYILENLTLEHCAHHYVKIFEASYNA